MLRSILVALDGSPSRLNAACSAVELARHHAAHVKGLGVINSVWVQRPEAVPIGGMAFKSALGVLEMQDATERVGAILSDFILQAKNAGITSHEVSRVEGAPLKVIEAEAMAFDLIALGRHSMFEVEGELCDLPLCVDRIIRDQPRPVLLVPDEPTREAKPNTTKPEATKPVLVAFDGSAASSRALHIFAILGLAEGRVAHVVTLDHTSSAAAEEKAGRACALLARHGAIKTHAIGMGEREAGRPAETILGVATAIDPDIIVMGAYGRRGIRELFGSCTRTILKESPIATFLYH